MFKKGDLERFKKMAAASPMQQRINAVRTVEELGTFIDSLRTEQANLVAGVDLDTFMETFVTVCAKARANRKLWGDEILENPKWSDFADLFYTSLLYE